MGPAPSGPDRVQREVVASVEHAVAAVAEHGRALGLTVQPPGRRFDADALRLAARFAHELELSAAQLCVWGGESTVRLPAHPGWADATSTWRWRWRVSSPATMT